MDIEYAKLILEIAGGFIALSSAFFAILQWKKGNDYKRAELVQQLIEKLNDDEDIALVLEMIDWEAGICYDGEFYIEDDCKNERVVNKEKEELFNMIDKTLSHCSFVCYLYLRKCLSKRDMFHFEYTIISLIENVHIRNYLFTINHFAKLRGTNCAFQDLIEYAIRKKYINRKDFQNPDSKSFKLCLDITDDTEE